MMLTLFFNVQFDKDKKVELGDGSDENHMNICFTSKKLMSNIEYKGIHHIDGTYRISIYGFPLVVYGVRDQKGRFHPVCYMITSHETYEDFVHFYQGICDLCDLMDIEYDYDYIMQDACPASRSAILEFFPIAFAQDFKVGTAYFFSIAIIQLENFLNILPRPVEY